MNDNSRGAAYDRRHPEVFQTLLEAVRTAIAELPGGRGRIAFRDLAKGCTGPQGSYYFRKLIAEHPELAAHLHVRTRHDRSTSTRLNTSIGHPLRPWEVATEVTITDKLATILANDAEEAVANNDQEWIGRSLETVHAARKQLESLERVLQDPRWRRTVARGQQ